MNLTITAAGRAALINAQNTGTNAITITAIGLSETAFDATPDVTTLPKEIKRLDTFAGELVDDDTLHVTIRDESNDAYQLIAFGLYSDDDTLFAVYSQPEVILEKTPSAVALLAVDIKLAAADAALINITGDTSFMLPPGTESVPGLLQLTQDSSPLDDRHLAVHSARVTQMINLRFADSGLEDVAHWNAAWHWGNHAVAGYRYAGTGNEQVRNNSQLDARYVQQASRGVAGGVATLDANAKIPLNQINDSVLGQVEYKGVWDAANNVPALPSVPAKKGDYYIVKVAGSQFGLTFELGDWLISNGSQWDKVDNTDAVSSVNGRTGHVSLNAADVGAAPTTHSHSWSQVSGIPATASRWPSWSEVSSKPASFPPAGHSHTELGGNNYVSGGLAAPSFFGSGKLRYQMLGNGNNGLGGVPGISWSDCLWISAYSGTDVKVSNLLCMDKSGAGRIGFRQQTYDASTWGQFNEIYHTGHKPSYAEVGAAPATHTHSWSQVANIPVTASRWPAWSEVSSKPATFPPAAHTHDYVPTARKVNGKPLTADISLTAADVGAAASSHSHSWSQVSGIPATASRWPSWNEVSSKPSSFTPSAHSHTGKMTFTLLLGSAVAQGNFTLSAPYSSFDGLVVIAGGDDSSYAAMSFLPTDMLNAVRSLGLDVCLLQSDGIRFRGYFSSNNQTFVTTSENAKVHRIYGYKYTVS